MTKEQLDNWVAQLGKAWVNLDVDAALALVDKQDVEWYESPLEKPLTSWDDIYKVWEKDLVGQKDISFTHEVLACNGDKGVIRWQASLTEISTNQIIDMDGIFLVSLNSKNLCNKFTMWTVSQSRK